MSNYNILPFVYLPNISWFLHLLTEPKPKLAIHTTYKRKGPYNRCWIKGANGPIRLSVPVVHQSEGKPMSHAIICNREPWWGNHQRSIQSAYGRCPFFEHYAHELFRILNFRHQSLFILQIELLYFLIDSLNFDRNIIELSFSVSLDNSTNYVELFNNNFKLFPYFQPFGIFVEDLSIIDLLFNCGPDSALYLKDALATNS